MILPRQKLRVTHYSATAMGAYEGFPDLPGMMVMPRQYSLSSENDGGQRHTYSEDRLSHTYLDGSTWYRTAVGATGRRTVAFHTGLHLEPPRRPR